MRYYPATGHGRIRTTLNGDEQWEGIDADYCRALAAALFASSDTDVLEFVEVQGTDDGLVALADGKVDVLAGGEVTLERDVLNPTTGRGFSFTTPYFYFPSTLPANRT